MKSAQVDSFIRDQLPPAQAWPEYRFDLPELQFPEQINAVASLLDDAIAKKGFADHVMLRSVNRDFTYRQAQLVVNRIAAYLMEDCQLVPGNRVLLRGPNSMGMALCWLAVVKAGLVAVATMPLLRAKELSEIIAKAQPALALCDGQWLAELETAHQQTASAMKQIICFNSEGSSDLGQLCASKSGEFAACPTLATDIAMMAFTSGTTGLPKAAVHLHRSTRRLRMLAAPCVASHAIRHHHRLAPFSFHLRLGRLAALSDVGRRERVLSRQSLHTGSHGRCDQHRESHHQLHRAHVLSTDDSVCQGQGHRQLAHQRERGRRLARCDAAVVERSHRARDAGWHWRNRDVSYLHF
jgi:AMP-binding enzyme